MGNYAHTWSDLRPGSIDVDSARGGIYATYFNNCFYLNGGIYGGYNSYDSSRRGLQGNANGNSDGAELSTFGSGGYDFHLGYLTDDFSAEKALRFRHREQRRERRTPIRKALLARR
jgi:outer membrane autotransporter protein